MRKIRIIILVILIFVSSGNLFSQYRRVVVRRYARVPYILGSYGTRRPIPVYPSQVCCYSRRVVYYRCTPVYVVRETIYRQRYSYPRKVKYTGNNASQNYTYYGQNSNNQTYNQGSNSYETKSAIKNLEKEIEQLKGQINRIEQKTNYLDRKFKELDDIKKHVIDLKKIVLELKQSLNK